MRVIRAAANDHQTKRRLENGIYLASWTSPVLKYVLSITVNHVKEVLLKANTICRFFKKENVGAEILEHCAVQRKIPAF